MEPTFASEASMTVTLDLQSQIDAAIAALPPVHCAAPYEKERAESTEAAFIRLQDWAFTKGFALVIESNKYEAGVLNWVIFRCSYHLKKARNTRKTKEEDRQRVETKTQAKGCQFSLYVSYRKRLHCWAIGSTHLEHNHAPNPDPFQYQQHQSKRPGYAQSLALAETHRGVIGFKQSAEILQKEGLEINRKKFYNLNRRDQQGQLTRQEELELILYTLKEEGVHPRVREEYIEENGIRTGRVIKDLFWQSPEQIKMSRRFVSGFMYETDATFNTNSLRLPLGVMVGIDNTGRTFPVAYCYITSESAASFKWIAEQLTDLVFYDCPEPALIVGDFSKGLGAAVAAKATADLAGLEPTDECLAPEDDLLEAVDVVVGESTRIRLQLCEWHAIEAIKRRFIAVGRYTKEKREELMSLVNA
jgi:MULE transposase domain